MWQAARGMRVSTLPGGHVIFIDWQERVTGHGTGSRTNLEPGRFLPETVDQEIFSKPHYSALRQSENIIKRSKIASELTGRSRSN